jgi:L-malate glycosyltransferase
VSPLRKHILFIASWYPHSKMPNQGVFIRRHAIAASSNNRISVVFAYGDASLAAGQISISIKKYTNLTEFYVAWSTKLVTSKLLEPWVKSKLYKKAIAKGVNEAIQLHGKPELLHLHVIWHGIVGALPILKQLKIPLIISEHWSGYLPEDGNYQGLLMKYYTRKAIRLAKKVTVVSKAMQNSMEKHGLEASYSILHNSVDTTIFRLPRLEDNKSTSIFKLIHVSSLVEREKNCSGLLRVMQNFKNVASIQLYIIGDGNERPILENYARELGIDKNVFFVGALVSEKVAEIMQQSNALILFSHFEGMPCVISEAQCCGLPILATRVGGIPQMVNEKQGILVESGNEAEMTAAINKMMKNHTKYDPYAIHKHAISRYSYEKVSNDLNQLYNSI